MNGGFHRACWQKQQTFGRMDIHKDVGTVLRGFLSVRSPFGRFGMRGPRRRSDPVWVPVPSPSQEDGVEHRRDDR